MQTLSLHALTLTLRGIRNLPAWTQRSVSCCADLAETSQARVPLSPSDRTVERERSRRHVVRTQNCVHRTTNSSLNGTMHREAVPLRKLPFSLRKAVISRSYTWPHPSGRDCQHHAHHVRIPSLWRFFNSESEQAFARLEVRKALSIATDRRPGARHIGGSQPSVARPPTRLTIRKRQV